MNPEILVKVVQEQMQKEFYVGVSKTKAFRAKAKAQLQRCNPDTIVKIDVYREEDPYKTTRMFRIIYVCLGALKMGFKEDGRDLLGLDGAFMRGQYPGQMLKVVGVDANNRIYPVAYGIMESKNQYSWTWFLSCLADDLELLSNFNFTFITDRQKGMLLIIAKLFPVVEHRYCVRHINENMKLTWRGGDYKES
ncbi:putative transposase, mutator type, MULE transposase domain protein [Tanacetum coccineum]